MIFENAIKNKVTEFKVKEGDNILTITHEYKTESMETVVEDFNVILRFLGYSGNEPLKDFYKEEIIEDYLDKINNKINNDIADEK